MNAVFTDGRLSEKKTGVSSGIYIYDSEVLDEIPKCRLGRFVI